MIKGWKNKYALILLCFTGLVQEVAGQQNIQFTQYIFNSLSVNPAYAGYKEEWFLQATHRMQWTGLEGAPVTSQVSVDGVTNEDTRRIGLGMQLTADKLGAQSATSLYANYAYRIRLDEEDTRRLSLGVGAGVTQYGLDGSVLDAVTGDDQVLTTATLNSYIPDVRVGLYYSGQKWYFGLSAMDLLSGHSRSLFNGAQDTARNVMRKTHLYMITGALLNLSEYTRFRPGILWKEDFKGPSVVDLNAMFVFGNRFWLGASYRTGVNFRNKEYTNNQALSLFNSVSGIVQLVVSDNLRLGYSYDYTLNGLGSYQQGSHEITLGYTFRRKSQRVLSPRFF